MEQFYRILFNQIIGAVNTMLWEHISQIEAIAKSHAFVNKATNFGFTYYKTETDIAWANYRM